MLQLVVEIGKVLPPPPPSFNSGSFKIGAVLVYSVRSCDINYVMIVRSSPI